MGRYAVAMEHAVQTSNHVSATRDTWDLSAADVARSVPTGELAVGKENVSLMQTLPWQFVNVLTLLKASDVRFRNVSEAEIKRASCGNALDL
jgi:hypothetical protein